MDMNRLCRQTITLFGYVGEVERKAVWQATILSYIHLSGIQAQSRRVSGSAANDRVRLFIFDGTVQARGPNGVQRTYLAHEQWLKLDAGERQRYWSLAPEDRICEGITSDVETQGYRVQSIDRRAMGNRRMWHWEVYGA